MNNELDISVCYDPVLHGSVTLYDQECIVCLCFVCVCVCVCVANLEIIKIMHQTYGDKCLLVII